MSSRSRQRLYKLPPRTSRRLPRTPAHFYPFPRSNFLQPLGEQGSLSAASGLGEQKKKKEKKKKEAQHLFYSIEEKGESGKREVRLFLDEGVLDNTFTEMRARTAQHQLLQRLLPVEERLPMASWCCLIFVESPTTLLHEYGEDWVWRMEVMTSHACC